MSPATSTHVPYLPLVSFPHSPPYLRTSHPPHRPIPYPNPTNPCVHIFHLLHTPSANPSRSRPALFNPALALALALFAPIQQHPIPPHPTTTSLHPLPPRKRHTEVHPPKGPRRGTHPCSTKPTLALLTQHTHRHHAPRHATISTITSAPTHETAVEQDDAVIQRNVKRGEAERKALTR